MTKSNNSGSGGHSRPPRTDSEKAHGIEPPRADSAFCGRTMPECGKTKQRRFASKTAEEYGNSLRSNSPYSSALTQSAAVGFSHIPASGPGRRTRCPPGAFRTCVISPRTERLSGIITSRQSPAPPGTGRRRKALADGDRPLQFPSGTISRLSPSAGPSPFRNSSASTWSASIT